MQVDGWLPLLSYRCCCCCVFSSSSKCSYPRLILILRQFSRMANTGHNRKRHTRLKDSSTRRAKDSGLKWCSPKGGKAAVVGAATVVVPSSFSALTSDTGEEHTDEADRATTNNTHTLNKHMMVDFTYPDIVGTTEHWKLQMLTE